MSPDRVSPSADGPGSAPAVTGDSTLLDRLRRWCDVVLSQSPRWAFDGETVHYLSDEAGLLQPWSVARAGGSPRPLAPTAERAGALHPSPTQPEMVIATDEGGDEHWRLALLSADGRSPPRAFAAEAGVIHQPGAWSSEGGTFYFTANGRDRRFFDVYAIDPHAPTPAQCIRQEDATLGVADARGGRVLVRRHRSNLDTDLLLLDGGRWVHLNPHVDEQMVDGAALALNDVFAASNPLRDRCALVRFRFSGAGPEFVREYPGEVELVKVSPDGMRVALTVNRDGWSETHLLDPGTGEDRPLLSGPKGVVHSLDWSPDGTSLVYDLSYAEGWEVFSRNLENGKERRLTRTPRPLPDRSVEPRLAMHRASDGVTIPRWEYLPRAGPVRGTIVEVHGGPEAQSRPEFRPIVQFLVAEGWRVISPNVRGSTGYGRKFVHLDDRERRPDSVRDLSELVAHLLGSGRAESGRIAIVGGSYGGYMVLMALSTYPELFAAGVDIVGIANFLTFLQHTGPWRRALREAEYGSLERDAEMLRAISPLFRADRIRSPLLVLHGRNDPRVPFEEAEQIVATLQGLGRTVELVEFPGEGHGFHLRSNRLDAWARAAGFLDRHLPPPKPAPGGPR
ncbi:MAG TPA: S9 family peptidase [Thermoplasmata archaeon]|nr:S9 family peptidase [Thermoplasmata archaeon]